MINYRNPLTRKFINSILLGALLSSPVVGVASLMMWDYVFHGAESAVPDATILIFALSWFGFLGMIVPALVQCPSIVVTDEGLQITSFVFMKFNLLWEDIVDVWTYPASSKVSEMEGGRQKSLVRIKRGLTFLHRSLPRKEVGRWQWLRGFTIASAGTGYNDLVRVIEAHVGKQKELKSFYKPQV